MIHIIERGLFAVVAILFSAVSFSGCLSLGGDGQVGEKPENPTSSPAAQEAAADWGTAKINYRLPKKMTLCGEAIPLHLESVYERLDYEFMMVVNHPAQVELWRLRALKYFPMIEAQLKKAELPDDLKYLAVAESDLRPSVASGAGAVGIWQFMPGTARQFGLKVDKNQDERHLPEPLLDTGLTYLNSLYKKFGKWSVAMAAYNAGDSRVNKAITNQGVSDYYQLNLPRETERYVYRIAAVKYVLENYEQLGFNRQLSATSYKQPQYSEIQVTFNSAQTWPDLAKKAGCSYKTLRSLNPHLTQKTLKGGPYRLRVPSGTESAFQQP